MPPADRTLLTIIQHTPLVSIDLIIYNPKGEVLLGLRRNRPARGTWFVPGGRIRKDERISLALLRIAKTEVGLELEPRSAHLLGVYEHMYEDNFSGKAGVSTHYVVLGFEIHLDAPFDPQGDDQHSRMQWWSIKQLLASPEVHANTKAYFSDFTWKSGMGYKIPPPQSDKGRKRKDGHG
jgi:colanic acid biosynthesis protein WcaH